MIDQAANELVGSYTFIIRPNRSLTDQQAVSLVLAIGIISMTIAGAFAYLGAWMVLPFSGLEWVLLAYCVHLHIKSSKQMEKVEISDNLVRVEKLEGNNKKFESVYNRAWVKVFLNKPLKSGWPSRLCLGQHGKQTEIGYFLIEREKEQLAKLIKNSLTNLYQ